MVMLFALFIFVLNEVETQLVQMGLLQSSEISEIALSLNFSRNLSFPFSIFLSILPSYIPFVSLTINESVSPSN